MSKKTITPDLNTFEVVKRLGFKTRRSVDILVEKGPEHGGLPAYVNYGSGWQRHTGPAKGRTLFFNSDEVEAWDKAHPATLKEQRTQEKSEIKPDPQMVKEVLEEAEAMKTEQGKVNRKELLKRLYALYGPGRYHRWYYRAVKEILDKNGYPPIRPQPEARRQYKAS